MYLADGRGFTTESQENAEKRLLNHKKHKKDCAVEEKNKL